MTYRVEDTLTAIVEYAKTQNTEFFLIDELLAVVNAPRVPAVRNIKSCVAMGWIELREDRLQFRVTEKGREKAEQLQNFINKSAIKPEKTTRTAEDDFYGV